MNRSLLPRRLKAVPVRYRSFSSLVLSPTELSNALTAQRSTAPSSPIVPISADWYLPTSLRNGYDEYLKLRIPNARFLDIDRVKDSKSPYPHMLPDSETFTTTMRALGIRRDDTVVVYDSPHDGIFAAPRAVWMLRVFGHPKVHLLDNFRGWVERGFPTESGEVQNGGWEESDYPLCRRDNELVVTYEEMVKLAGGGGGSGVQVLDARPTGRFWGTQEEPRTGLSSGHVPGARSVPMSELLDPVMKTFRPAPELRKIFAEKGIDSSPQTEKVLMCGTGVTALVIATALEIAGVEGKRRVYDGSWTEWAQRVDPTSGLIVKKPKD